MKKPSFVLLIFVLILGWESLQAQSVQRLVLINASSNSEIRDLPLSGDTIDLDANPYISFRAVTNPEPLTSGQCGFQLTYPGGSVYNHSEGVSVYACFGDNSGDYIDWESGFGSPPVIEEGAYTLKVTPGAGTPSSYGFVIVKSGGGEDPGGGGPGDGEPFDTLSVDMELAPLGDVAGAGAVLLLSALAIGVMGVALFALYRMVAVTVSFAERRANFVAAVSHELKTPLTAIRMYGEMLRDGLVSDEAKKAEYYRSITAESERLSRLINNVLEFSRLERGSRNMDLRMGDVTPALREAVELLEPHAELNGQRLALEVGQDLPAVPFEHDALLQVLFNLIDNALKYASGAAQPVIEIRAERVGVGLEISVRDHGPGIAPEHAARILEPFYRGENELTRKTQGTGIGLSLVKELTEEMGARLRVGNAPGGGFRAVLELAAP